MKKLLCVLLLFVFSMKAFTQCDPATIKDMPTLYSKENKNSLKPMQEQEKWMTTIFASVVEPALKNTKGLRGGWETMGDFPETPQGLATSNIQSYLFTLGCKDNKLYEKHEEGLVLNFTLNGLNGGGNGNIARVCEHEETRWKKFDDSRTIYIEDVFEGRQVYYLQPATEKNIYPNLSFYRMTEDGAYFVVTKPGAPFFIPLTRKQALEINKKNTNSMLEEIKKAAAMPGLQPETRADYEKKMAKDFAAYRETIPNPEAFITDLIKQLEDVKPAMIKQQQFFINSYSKQIELITTYLKNTPVAELNKPCITGNFGLLSASFGDNTDEVSGIQSNFQETANEKYGMLVTLNPAYFNKMISKTAPQFIAIEIRIQGGGPVELKAYNDFISNIDFEKLKSLIVK